MKVLFAFRHGLGDAVQFTSVLRHVRKELPHWQVDVVCQVGKHTAFRGLCAGLVWVGREDQIRDYVRDSAAACKYDRIYDLDWFECRRSFGDWPSTKAEQCLWDVLQIKPDPALWGYSIEITEEQTARARTYLASIARPREELGERFPVMLLHYEGNTSAESKNLTHQVAGQICEAAIAGGLTPCILDWETPLRSPLPDGTTIFNPRIDNPLWDGEGTGDAGTLAALIANAALMVGVDSGPLHVAGATATPTLGVWIKNHPVHYFAPNNEHDNVLHLVPTHHERLAAGHECVDFFNAHYRHKVYRRLGPGVTGAIANLLTGSLLEEPLSELRTKSYGVDYYEEHREAGLDYLFYGEWQKQYGAWIVGALGLKGKTLLDVGCACGSIVRGFGEAGAVTQGVDVNEYMISIAKQSYADFENILFVCDAVNLHLFGDATWDAIHSAQVAEHWRPELVPFILKELYRITKPGGLFFCALDTLELFARQGRQMELEDPTHICVRSLAWWYEQLLLAGWELCPASHRTALADYPGSFMRQYDWDWWLARKPENQAVSESGSG